MNHLKPDHARVIGGAHLFIFKIEFPQHYAFHPEDRAIFSNPEAQFPVWFFVGILFQSLFLLCISMMITNSLESLLPPIKARTERASDCFPNLTIRGANRELAKAALYLAIVAGPSFAAGIIISWQHRLVVRAQEMPDQMAAKR